MPTSTIAHSRIHTRATEALRKKLLDPSGFATVRIAADVSGCEIWASIRFTGDAWAVSLDRDRHHETKHSLEARFDDIDDALDAIGFWDVAVNGNAVIVEGP